MISIKANLRSCVNDMTQQGRQKLFEKYFQELFKEEDFLLTVKLSEDTYKRFTLRLTHVQMHTIDATAINYELYLEEGLILEDRIFSGKLVITQSMTTLAGILCALHITGDYIKFAFSPISLGSEENHNV